jgi:hypothetical protein
LLPTLQKCLDSEGVHLVEAAVDYSGNHKLLDRGLVCPE